MIRFNRSLVNTIRFFGGSHHPQDPNLKRIDDSHIKNKQQRDRLHLPYLDQGDLEVLPEHKKARTFFSIYNFASYLPHSIINRIGKLGEDSKTTLRTENLYLPKLTENGVRVYDSIRNSQLILQIKKFEILIPLLYLTSLHHIGPMLITTGFFWLVVYRPSLYRLASRFVIKMELDPDTEQIIYQKVGFLGEIKTSRVRIDDLQYYDRSNFQVFFYRTCISLIDTKMSFRVKSTGEILVFDPQGLWYEEGINHELLV